MRTNYTRILTFAILLFIILVLVLLLPSCVPWEEVMLYEPKGKPRVQQFPSPLEAETPPTKIVVVVDAPFCGWVFINSDNLGQGSYRTSELDMQECEAP